MDQNGQLTFSDDPILARINELYQLIEEGKFAESVPGLDELMDANPDYPGLVECFRTVKFWNNRKYEMDRIMVGKKKADYLMKEWADFNRYAAEKNLTHSVAYRSVMRYIFFTASHNYKIAFQNQESTADNFELLLNLGICFLTLEEYKPSIETLEYARSSFKTNARLLSILGEAYYHINEIPRSLGYFREAFFINPSEIDLALLKSKPIRELVAIVEARRPAGTDVREWVPIYGCIEDIFFVRRTLNSQQVEGIKKEIYSLERSFQTLGRDKVENSNIVPRLINRYLWMLDYFETQHFDFNSVTEIRDRLMAIDRDLFEDYFKNRKTQH